MIGVQAAEYLLLQLAGATLHRRGIRHGNHFYDLHARMSDAVLAGAQVDPNYMMSLGTELSGLDRDVFDKLLDVIKAEVDTQMPPTREFGDAPYLVDEKICPSLFKKLRGTCFWAIVRNYMGKCLFISRRVAFEDALCKEFRHNLYI